MKPQEDEEVAKEQTGCDYGGAILYQAKAKFSWTKNGKAPLLKFQHPRGLRLDLTHLLITGFPENWTQAQT